MAYREFTGMLMMPRRHPVRIPLYMAVLIAALIIVYGLASPSAAVSEGAQRTDGGGDAALFEAIIRHRLASASVGEVRVDPRPLRDDPSLATLHGLGEIVPDLVPATVQHAPFAKVKADVLDRRRSILTALGVDEADGLRYVACPGVMVPPSDEVTHVRRERCPETDYQIVMVGQPRPGGVLLPPNIDERAKYAGRSVHSVRVIRRDVGPRGSVETSADYVFERVEDDTWRLLEVRELLIIE